MLDGRFDERDISYDRNGNILTLTRTDGSGVADNLAYSYIGNQLSSLAHNNANGGVPQAGTFGYSYDSNGNMTADARKRLQIEYNWLNLLQKAMIPAHTDPIGNLVPAETAFYTWLADGTKASVVDAQGNGFAYLGSLTYKLMNGTPTLESTSHGSGRIVVRDGAEDNNSATLAGTKVYDRQYHITDHLGSVRVVFNQDGEVLARNDYYPFGKPHANPSLAAPSDDAENRFLYNGKEKQLTGGLSFLDFGARMYDNETGRWFNPDPLAEERNWLSPYNFVQNNPLMRVDKTGALDDWYFNENGSFLGQDNQSSSNIRIISQSSWDSMTGGGYGENTIDGAMGAQASVAFSESGISDAAALNVLGKFNSTGLQLEAVNLPESSGTIMSAKINFEGVDGGNGKLINPKVNGAKSSILVNMTYSENTGILDNANNVVNSFVHEGQHKADANANPTKYRATFKSDEGDARRENSAINAQMNHPSYQNTTPSFKDIINKYQDHWNEVLNSVH